MIRYEIQLQITDIYHYKLTKVDKGDSLKYADGIYTGSKDEYNFMLIQSFNTKEDALDALKKYKSCAVVNRFSDHVVDRFDEYFVEENMYDDDGTWIGCGDILEYADIEYEEMFGESKKDYIVEWENRVKNEKLKRYSWNKNDTNDDNYAYKRIHY